jgi:carbonic anhydrase
MTRSTIRIGALVAGAAALVALAGCTAAPAATDSSAADSEAVEVSWAYAGDTGPAGWGALDAEFATCGTGTRQSPIDLPAPAADDTAEEFDGAALSAVAASGSVVDTGHTFQFVPEEAEDAASRVEFDGDEFELLQMHVHTPSEHTVGGVPAPAEFHLVHEDDDGDLLVVGVLAADGAESAAWDPFVSAVAAGGSATTELDLPALLPDDLGFAAYEGSLTTPPCSEDVQWMVLSTPVELSTAQLAALTGATPGNARPVAPLGDREIDRGAFAAAAG